MQNRNVIVAPLALAGLLSFGAAAQNAQPVPPPPPPSISALINGGIDALSQRALPTLGAVAAVGVLTMAVQQALKALFRYHRRFNALHVETWARERTQSPGLKGLVTLATAGQHPAIADAKSLCDLDGPGLTAQLTLAAKLALMFPDQSGHADVLRMVAGGIGDPDVNTLLGKTAPPPTPAAIDDARTRLGFLIDRSMDTLQVRLTYEWARVNQMMAFGLSAVIAAVAGGFYYWNQGILARPWDAQGMHYLMIFLGAILSGILAPVAKDLVTALQSLKGR